MDSNDSCRTFPLIGLEEIMKNRLNYFRRFLLTIIVMCLLLSGCSSGKTTLSGVNTAKYDEAANDGSELESGIIAENGAFSVEWNNENKRVTFVDSKNGKRYSATPSEAAGETRYDEDGMPIKNNPRIESAIAVTYFDSEKLKENTVYSYLGAVQNGQVFSEKIKDGIRVTYDFTDEKISVPVEYTIKEDCFEISVEPKEICDNGKDYVTGVSISPFICGVKNDSGSDSYLFVPDGSGAIIHPKTESTVGTTGSTAVYGGDRAIKQYIYNAAAQQCYMPVFGMKSGDSGLCAVIDSAAERASVSWDVGSSNLQYSTVYPSFQIRGYNLIEQPSGFGSYPTYIKVFRKDITDERVSVKYYPLYGADCGYNDMADIYRSYLMKTYSLNKGNRKEKSISLEIEGGVMEKNFFCGIPYNSLAPMTTVEQANEMIEYFSKLTENMLVRLCGFTKSGLDAGEVAGGFKISSSLGGTREIKALTELCREKNIDLSLDFDTTAFNKNGSGYSTKRSSALFSDGEINYLTMFDPVTGNSNNEKYFLLSRSQTASVLSKAAGAAKKYGFDTVGVGTLGKLDYSDYGNAETHHCNRIQEDTVKNIGELKKSSSVVMTGANDYAAAVCDYIVDAPLSSSKYDVFDYDIPFYSMVFKGYVPMNSGALNLAADGKTELLKCVESGISPTYTLFYQFSQNLVTSEYEVTRSSEYEACRNDIKDTILQTKSIYEAISGAEITEHAIISEDVRRVNYSNGATVYVNYGSADITAEDVLIPAGSFAIRGEKDAR